MLLSRGVLYYPGLCGFRAPLRCRLGRRSGSRPRETRPVARACRGSSPAAVADVSAALTLREKADRLPGRRSRFGSMKLWGQTRRALVPELAASETFASARSGTRRFRRAESCVNQSAKVAIKISFNFNSPRYSDLKQSKERLSLLAEPFISRFRVVVAEDGGSEIPLHTETKLRRILRIDVPQGILRDIGRHTAVQSGADVFALDADI